MLRIQNIKMPVEPTEEDLKEQIKKIIKTDQIEEINIYKRSIDSRKKSDISFIYTVDVKADVDEEKILKNYTTYFIVFDIVFFL